MSAFLFIAVTCAGVAYIGVMFSALRLRRRDTYDALMQAARRYRLAVALAALILLLDIAAIPSGGFWRAAITITGAVIALAGAIGYAVLTDMRRDEKTAELIREWLS